MAPPTDESGVSVLTINLSRLPDAIHPIHTSLSMGFLSDAVTESAECRLPEFDNSADSKRWLTKVILVAT